MTPIYEDFDSSNEVTTATGGRYYKSDDIQGKHNRLVSVCCLGEMPTQSGGQSVSAPRGKAGVRLNAHTELRAKRQRSAREAMYRNRSISMTSPVWRVPWRARCTGQRWVARGVAAQVEFESND